MFDISAPNNLCMQKMTKSVFSWKTLEICTRYFESRQEYQGSKFVVAMVANATMFSYLLPGCSSGSKHLLLLAIVNFVHAFFSNVCNVISYAT